MTTTEMYLYSFILLAVVIGVAGFISGILAKRRGRESAVKSVSQYQEDNTPLSEPCTIVIQLNYTNDYAVNMGWKYGFSLNGAEPQYAKLKTQLIMTTDVEKNALLGYGLTGITGYKPSIEEPFVFTAVPGGVIRLKADLYSSTKESQTLRWTSNLSFDE